MDISHERPGDLVISLSLEDLNFLRAMGYCSTKNGLSGYESKVWVRNSPLDAEPNVKLDAASDVYVELPDGADQTLPVRIEQASMNPYMDQDLGRVAFHFGEDGAVIIQASGE